ncbi:MAG: SusC/RagA family TonB-linked outer membrane protein, partial [Bacteroidales bacterium]|nr:SusC/RagA family TonB-linked outer membrane protein [Bacteroidales bacterium]
MKWVIVFLALAINMGYASDNYSQSTIISIDVKDKAIKEVFTETGENSEVSIMEGTMDTDTIVVVGFGKQKKTDLVGSITTVRITDLKKISSSNVTTMLAGNVAGLISYQRSGEPGADDASLFIRGVTTFGYIGNGEPLILIDGVEAFKTDLARMQPDDIESISVMKDAVSTAVYGTRGANGVISVTTKEGKTGRVNISARFENAFNMPTKNIEFADPITYMRLGNEAVLTRDPLGELPYSQFKIQGTLDKVDKYLFPATDWRKELMKNYVTMPRVNLNIRGGKDELRYYLSGTFNQDNGILKNDKRNYFNNNIKLKTWSFRANVNLSMTKTTEAALKISGTFDDYIGPVNGGANLYRQIMHASPVLFPPYYVSDKEIYKHEILFGNYGNAEYINPYAETFRGVKNYSQSKIDGQFELKQDFSFLTEGLSLKALFNGSRYKYSDESRFYDPRYYTLDDTYTLVPLHSGGPASYRNSGETKFTTVYVQLIADYHRTFAGKHTFSGMVTYLMSKDVIKHEWNSDFSLTRKTMGLSGRATYSYRGKYSGEFNFGYSGSECDHRDYHFGFFPSAGLAWTISNEDFWNVPVVSNLKLRASYGLAGNDVICCDFRRAGFVWETDPNDLSGEIARKTNIGFELGLFGKLDMEADFFHEHRTNILM